MSRDMENQSLSDRHSLTGNSGLLGLPSVRPKLQPLRVKTLMEMYCTDDEDSEDVAKESDSDSDCEDIQPLPDDHEEANEAPTARSVPAERYAEKTDNRACTEGEKIDNRNFEKQHERRHVSSSPKREKSQIIASSRPSDSFHFTDNFITDKPDEVKLENHKSSSLPGESSSAGFFASASVPKSSIETNRQSNTTFRAPELPYCTTNKSAYTLITAKSECSTVGGHAPVKSSLEVAESTFFSSKRHSHPTMVSHQSELPPTTSSASVLAPSMGHLSLDTPIKNNPPVGSMRPTPSLSHRSMFQTPQSSKLNHQEYATNREQTPGTIFGNWSQRHMAQTPLQTRPTILSGDSARSQTPSILSTQHASTPAAVSGSVHETPWYRGNSEKKVRRPLGESMQSSVNHQSHSQNEKPSSHYTAESSAVPSKHRESPDGPQTHGVLETIREKPSNKSVAHQHQPQQQQQQQQQHQQHQHQHQKVGHHESKENKHPSPLIEKLTPKEDDPASRGTHETVKGSIGSSYKQNIPNENRPEAARHRVEACDTPASRGVRSNNPPVPKNTAPSAIPKNTAPPVIPKNTVPPAIPKNTAPPAIVEKKDGVAQKKANVQLSIPSSIRRVNQGETMVVQDKEYLILGTLGEGMTGQVLRVQDLTSLELRAIKVVNLSRMDKECAQGCLQEIGMLHKLQAPCVVRMFDYEIQYPMVHVVMEMGDTDFRSLLHSMSEKKRLPLTMILYYWTEMLTAVKHIHDNGVIHSDLKPANFLLVRGRLKLIDFGIASSMNPEMTSVVKNSPIGTLNYISPEAVMDIGSGGSGGDSPNHNVRYKITFKSDVWSLGCILYSLVYGYTPFHNIRAQWAKIQAITNPNPKISFALPAGNDAEPTPPILIDVMRKCLQHDPKARPTVAQLLQIPYIPTKPISRATTPDIPSNIVMKIRQSLTDDEWRQFTEIMEAKRNQS